MRPVPSWRHFFTHIRVPPTHIHAFTLQGVSKHSLNPYCHVYTHSDVYTHTHRSVFTHTQRSMRTHTDTEECVLTYRPYRSMHTHAFTKHTYTSTHANQPSTRPDAGTRSVCTDSPLLLAPNTLSAQSHRDTQFGSVLSHGDSSVSLSFTGLSVSIRGTWNGSWDVR